MFKLTLHSTALNEDINVIHRATHSTSEVVVRVVREA